MRGARWGAVGAVVLLAFGASAVAAGTPAAFATPVQGQGEVQAGLETIVTTLDSVRGGGAGAALVDVTQRAHPGVTAHQVAVRIVGAGGIAVTRATGPRWACTAADGVATCTRARVYPSSRVAPIAVSLRGQHGLRDGTAPLTATVSWRERSGARTAPGVRATPTARTGFTQYADATPGAIETDPRLRVAVAPVGSTVALERAGDATHLRADIVGVSDATASIDWRQACLTQRDAVADPRCRGQVAPAARMISPAHADDAAAVEILAVEMPVTASPTRLVFDATVREGGATTTGSTTVTTHPVAAPTYDPRIDTIDELRGAGRAGATEPISHEVTPTRLAKGGVGTSGPTMLVPGRPATLTARVTGRAARGATWRVVGDGQELLRGAVQRGMQMRVVPPPRLAGAVITLIATVTLRDGTTIELPELVMVNAPPRAGPRRAPSARLMEGVQAAATRTQRVGTKAEAAVLHDTRSPSATACELADRVQQGKLQPLPSDPNPGTPGASSVTPDDAPAPDVAMGDTGLLWLGNGTATSTSGTCSVTFSGGQLRYGDYAFINVSGRITSDGLRVLGGAFNPPERWLEKLGPLREQVQQAANEALSFSVPADSALRLGAGIAKDGTWGDLGGQLTIDAGLSMLPLPNGWRFLPAKVELDATGVMSLTITAAAPQGEPGSVAITGSAGGAGAAELDVEAPGLVVMQQVVTDPATGDATTDPATGAPQMSQVTANFQGTFTFTSVDNPAGTASSKPVFQLSANIAGSLENLTLASQFTLERIGFEWSPGGITAEARARVGRGPEPTTLLVGTGSYKGSDEWSVGISTKNRWQVTRQLAIESLDGSMRREKGRTTISARGAAIGWPAADAFAFDSITAELTNGCPTPETKERPCTQATARVALEARGSVTLPQFASGTDERMPWNATASINLSNRIFTLTGGLSSTSGIGPAELKLTGIALQLSNDTARQWCTAPGAEPGAKGEVRMGIAATGEVFGKQVQFEGEFGGKAGLCLIGRMGTMPSDVPEASSFSEVEVAYTSQQVMVNLPGGGPRMSHARQVSVFSAFRLPKGVERAASGDWYLLGTLGLADRSIVATVGVQYGPSSRKIIAGSASGSHLALSALDFSFTWSRRDLAASATAHMDYVTPANPSSGIGASETPLFGSLAFDLPRATFTIAAGVETARVPGGVLRNAFGVRDLSVSTLAIKGSVGADTSIAFSAHVSLPDRWVGLIGIKKGTEEVLDFSISEVEPCMRVGIRRPQGDTTGTAVDLVNLGLVTAHEVGLTIAPVGCSLPGGEQVQPGFAFVFDGYLAGLFKVNINARVELPTVADPTHMVVFTHASIGAFNLGGVVKFDETVLDIDINTSSGTFKVGFSGGLDIIGNTVHMSVSLKKGAGLGDVAFSSHADADLGVVGFSFKGQEDLDFMVTGGQVQRFRIHALLNFRVLGVNVLGGSVDFDYDAGVVQKWGFEIGLGVPLIIASAEGHVSFDYAITKTPGRTRPVDPFTNKTFNVGFGGKLRFLFWSTSFDWRLFTYQGALQGQGHEGVSADDTDEQEQAKTKALPDVVWVRKHGTGRVRRDQPARVTSVAYRVNYRTTSTGKDAPTMRTTGQLDLTACVAGPAPGSCVGDADFSLLAHIDYLHRTIRVNEAQADCPRPDQCGNWRDVELTGRDWDAMVAWIEAARQAFAKDPAHQGRALPPVKAWSETSVPTQLGWVWLRPDNAPIHWTFFPSRRQNTPCDLCWGNPTGTVQMDGSFSSPAGTQEGLPSRAVPMMGDWDGDGVDSPALWYGRSRLHDIQQGAGLWIFRSDSGRVTQVPEPTPCTDNGQCQPVPPPGSEGARGISDFIQMGGAGAVFPVVGNWNGYGEDGRSPDAPGMVVVEAGVVTWHLRPVGGAPFTVTFGTFRPYGEAVPQPVTGDWNGDGTTDIGVYRPPTRPGRVGRFELLTSTRYGAQPEQLEPDPDITLTFGGYGETPITGDWNEDGITDVATASRPSPFEPMTVRQRYVRAESCSADCVADATTSIAGGENIIPIVGRWMPDLTPQAP